MGYKGTDKTRRLQAGWMTHAALTALLVSGIDSAALAQLPPPALDISAQPLDQALLALSRQANIDITAPSSLTQGKVARPVKGPMPAEKALATLLEGTGLAAKKTGAQTYTVVPTVGLGGVEPAEGDAQDILVTGSRIRGAPIASIAIVKTARQMQAAGNNTVADAIRDIPQNFGGGQNPGIGINVPEGNGLNLGSASTINLRGLGGDATLTLLNGHRLAYNVANQSIDVSSIPLGAVSRIEIIPDGSSALYGSDAVAGVANIVLLRDFDGIKTTARFGASTDGGNQQQQYSVTAGRTWNGGGFILAYDFERDTAIMADDRSYADRRTPELTLYPAIKHHDVLLSGHQSFAPNLELKVDALYNHRTSNSSYALTDDAAAAHDYKLNGQRSFFETNTFAIASTLTLSLQPGWEINLATMYGLDRSRYGSEQYLNNDVLFPTRGCYCNEAASAEISANGPIFRLPGGDAKMALGGGYRTNRFHAFRTQGPDQNIRASQDTYFGFGELSLPLISPDQSIPLVNRLNVSVAGRYEDNPGIGSIATPKLGVIYAPTADFDIKGSWGRSFKAPTLYQRYNSTVASLTTAARRGGAGYPSTATVIFLSGGNPDLKPERAQTWTLTLAAHPRALPGLNFEVGYFKTKYRDRVVAPITYRAQTLSNPIYADLVTLNPTDAQKAAALLDSTVSNSIGRPYNPADVVAIADGRNLNVSRQSIEGVDLVGSYTSATRLGEFGASLDVSYIESTQKLSGLQPDVDLAGTLFNPPHLRARSGVTLDTGTLMLGSFINYTGGVKDTRSSPSTHVGAMTTWDLNARYKLAQAPGLAHDLEIALSLQNLLNDKPAAIAISGVYETPYDSTNYSPVGRFISLSISKRW